MVKVSLLFLSLVTVLSGCGGGDRSATASHESVSGDQSKTDYALNRPAANSLNSSGGGGGGRQEAMLVSEKISLEQTTASQINTAPTDRKIIRNAELNREAENPEQAQQQITAIAELKGGFVVESQQSSSDIKSTTRDTVTMTVRVPAEKFGETLEEIRKTASRVVVESVKGQDVTEEFIDIDAQLKAKKALEQQFMEIMKRANTVDDALSVQSQLAGVRGEIERIEGRKRFLENQASLSTIKIRLQTAKVFAASSEGFGDRVAESFSRGFDIALNFILGLVTFVIGALPFALFIGLPGYLIARFVIKKAKSANVGFGDSEGRNQERINMDRLFQILAVILAGFAAYFLWAGNSDWAFVTAVLGCVAFFLSVRFQMKERNRIRELESEKEQ